jgi:hypothetical protein
VKVRGIRTEGPMAPEIALERARPAEYVYEKNLQAQLVQLREAEHQRA